MLKKFSESLPYYCEFNPIDIIWGISKIYREKRKVLQHLKYEKDNLHVEQEILVVGKRTAQGQELNFPIVNVLKTVMSVQIMIVKMRIICNVFYTNKCKTYIIFI